MKRLFTLAALASFVAAQSSQSCCTERGSTAAHAIGVIIFIIAGLSFNNLAMGWLGQWYTPGTPAFCRRMLLMEIAEVFFIIIARFASESVEQSEASSYEIFLIADSLVVVFLLVFWSRPIQRRNLFFATSNDSSMQLDLLRKLNMTRTSITGRRLVGERLRAEIQAFNREMAIKYAMCKAMIWQVRLTRDVDM
jgi:hypothetical protein